MDEFLRSLSALVPQDRFSTHRDQLNAVAQDESTTPPVVPRAVVWAMSIEEIAAVVSHCRRHSVPITTRGGGSALEGSAVPLSNGIVLDVSRMTGVINYWPDDLQVEVQPGLLYDNLNLYLKSDALFFPPSPGGSGDIASIGGMVSTNASGIYSVKYGATRDYILGLKVVTGTGEIMTFGDRAVKRSAGYNLVDLICGSEGTLAVIGSITLRLAGLPEGRRKEAFVFPHEVAASRAVSEMRRYGLDIAAIEFLDRRIIEALNLLKGYGLTEAPSLFLEYHGPQAVLDSNAELADGICRELGGERIELADGQNPWEIRHFATDAVKHRRPGYSILRNDVAFPISRLPEMVDFCHRTADARGIMIHTFGHVGMGLLHALMLARRDDSSEWSTALEVNELIIRKAIEFGGTVSGEHGIGLGHKRLFQEVHRDTVNLMRKIKRQFDPDGILNPGKIFDPEPQ